MSFGRTLSLSLMVPLAAVLGGEARAATIAAGWMHSCAVAPSGAAECWGSDSQGGLGEGTSVTQSYDPLPVSGLRSGVSDISLAGSGASGCAVHNRAAKCWGAGTSGQLGNGAKADSPVPVQVAGLGSGVSRVSIHGSHACAIQNGAARCWGSGHAGRLGDGASADRLTPVQPTGLESGVTDIAAGWRHSCAIQNGTVLCFGDNTNGQLGYSGGDTRVPRPVQGLPAGATRIAVGTDVSCAIVQGGAAWCWGYNNTGQLGNAEPAGKRTAPAQVTGLDAGVTDISVTWSHVCAVKSGAAFCWGLNSNGQLGNGAISVKAITPTAVSGLGSGVTAVAAGNAHSCGLASGKTLCWGRNQVGQLGNRTAGGQSPVPVPVVGAPVAGKRVVVAKVSGVVRIQRPGGKFKVLGPAESIPVGSTIDVAKGRVALTAAITKTGKVPASTPSAEFYAGIFQIKQQAATKAAELVLKGASFAKKCAAPKKGRSARAARSSKRVVRRLWGNGTGRFTSRGRYSGSTVRGTIWLTEDRCDGTLTRVKKGSVTVKDFRARRSVVVRAGRSYLARASRAAINRGR